MAESSSASSEPASGTRSWLEDDHNTTPEQEAAHWALVKKGSDELLDYYWNNYGKWAYVSFASACLLIGGIAGYKKGQEKEMVGVPVTRAVKMMALKAFAAGTVLCAAVSGVTAASVIYYYDFKSVDDFQQRMRELVPATMSPIPKTLDKIGLKRSQPSAQVSMDPEVANLDATMNQAFGKSDYYKEFKSEDYKHQSNGQTL